MQNLVKNLMLMLNSLEIKTPYVPFRLKTVVKSQQNKKATYQLLCKCKDIISWNDIKWNVDLELDVDKTLCHNIYMACLYTIKDNIYIYRYNTES